MNNITDYVYYVHVLESRLESTLQQRVYVQLNDWTANCSFYFRKTNIFDNVVYMMEKYADNLEDLVSERTAQLVEEKKKTDALLDRILPRLVCSSVVWQSATK